MLPGDRRFCSSCCSLWVRCKFFSSTYTSVFCDRESTQLGANRRILQCQSHQHCPFGDHGTLSVEHRFHSLQSWCRRLGVSYALPRLTCHPRPPLHKSPLGLTSNLISRQIGRDQHRHHLRLPAMSQADSEPTLPTPDWKQRQPKRPFRFQQ